MDIFSKLNSLKSIEPNKNWVVDAKKRVLSETPVFGRESVLKDILDKKANLGFNFQDLFQNLSFKKLMVPAFSLVFVLSGGIFTVGASKSSLPGEFLYSIKIINEDMALVIASENKKVTIEVEHAGKRLEEIAEISKKTSDVEQQKKIGQLMERFEEKMSSANDRLANTSGNGEKAKVAKVINTQSKKYTEVLAKTTDDLPAVIKDEIVEEVAKAIDSSEKINLTSLAAMVEGMTDEDRDEIAAMVKEKVGEIVLDEDDVVDDIIIGEVIAVEEMIIDSLEGESADDTENIANVEEKTETIEATREELIKLLDDLNSNLSGDNGDDMGDEDNVENSNDSNEPDSSDVTADEVDSGEVVSEEVEEVIIQEEASGVMSEESGL